MGWQCGAGSAGGRVSKGNRPLMVFAVLEMGTSDPKVAFKQGKISGAGPADSGCAFLCIVLAWPSALCSQLHYDVQGTRHLSSWTSSSIKNEYIIIALV